MRPHFSQSAIRFALFFSAFAGVLPAGAAPAPVLDKLQPLGANAATETDDIAKLFHDFCLFQQPSFEGMQAQAVVLHGAKAVDHTIPRDNNRTIHQQAWLVLRPSGVYQITAIEGDMASGARRTVGCGVTAQTGKGDEIAQALSMAYGLGAPFKRVPAVGNTPNSVVWNKNFGPHEAKILLTYGAEGMAGVSVHLILPNLPK